MAFDIFGNRLRPGYCEVHPDIAEEYPCSLCTENRQQDERQSRQDRYDEEIREWEESMAVQVEEERLLAEAEHGRNMGDANE